MGMADGGDDIWSKKCRVLKRKCDELEQTNGVLYSKFVKIQRIIEDAEREKRLLIKQLLKVKPLRRAEAPSVVQSLHSERSLSLRSPKSTSGTPLEPHGQDSADNEQLVRKEEQKASFASVDGDHHKLMKACPKLWNDTKLEDKKYCDKERVDKDHSKKETQEHATTKDGLHKIADLISPS